MLPIKVGNVYLPIDFFVYEMEEDKEIQSILGRPSLATVGEIKKMLNIDP